MFHQYATNQCKFSWIWRKKNFPPKCWRIPNPKGGPFGPKFFFEKFEIFFPFISTKLILWDFFRYFCFINEAPNGVCASVCMLKLKLYSAHTCTRCTKKLPRSKKFIKTCAFHQYTLNQCKFSWIWRKKNFPPKC